MSDKDNTIIETDNIADDKKPIFDPQSRKYTLVINNPVDKGWTHEKIATTLMARKGFIYFCMADEQGTTPHTHVFVIFKSPVRFTTIKKLFPEAHIEPAKGNNQQNRDYVAKSGKWENDDKHGTKIEGTFEESGEMPPDQQGKRNDLAELYTSIKAGKSDFEIMEENSDFIFKLDRIGRARQMLLNEQYKTVFREMTVTYIWGKPGTGKTRSVLDKYGYENVYRVTDYDNHPFDGYQGEKVLLLDEFRDGFRISFMLNLLDGYPLTLPCRYANKQACFDKVYIISNIPLKQQYKHIQIEQPNTWQALLRRIHRNVEIRVDGQIETPVALSDFEVVADNKNLPFTEPQQIKLFPDKKKKAK